ncbi:Flp pilus assembly protein CpaB [Sphingopyxis kveilinensis]|uniref:Flp pilus assembly protein CpaB n=1 Tax=Sphingopyxis kveilinensis TaxID=3114367 RepID=UPI0030CE8795
MDTRKIMLIVGALVIAISAAFGVNYMMRGAGAPSARAAAAADITGPMILVATRQLPVGTIIGPDSFRFQPWPKELVENAYFVKEKTDVNTLVGTVVRHPITAGQPLTQGALVHPDDRGFLAAALGPGMRAVTVKVSQEQGVAGFVFPGDRVDVMLTQTIDVEEGSAYPDKQIFTAETIVRNIRVLATDQRYDAEDETGKTPVRTFGSVTLEATPEIAEKIAVAQGMGRISLALRPLAESAGELDAAIASGEVEVPASVGTAAERKMLAQAAARPVANRSSATTGGDVSRFWIPVRGRVTAPRPQPAENSGNYAPVTSGRAASVPTGPVVRVTRGDKMTEVPVGGK